MKRNLLIGVVLLAVLLLFTGCDQVLEIFYPELVDNNAGYGNYRIKLNGQVDGSLTWYGQWINQSAPIRAAAIPYYETESGLIMAKDEAVIKDYVGANSGFTLEFYPLKKAQYKLIVWFDLNGNAIPDYEEPSLLAGWYPSGTWFNTVFDFTAPDTPSSIDAAVVLHDWDRAPWEVLDKLAGGATNYGFFIEGAGIVNYNYPNVAAYKIYPFQNSLYIQELGWKVTGANGHDCYVSGSVQHPSGATSVFSVDFASLWDSVSYYYLELGVTYTITVDVKYSDGGTSSGTFYVFAADEIPYTTSYDLLVDVSDLTSDPVWLDWGDHKFFFRTIESNNGWYSDTADLFNEAYVWPNASIGPSVINSGQVWGAYVNNYSYRSAPGLRGIQVIIDMNGNNWQDSGDWVSVIKPVGLTTGDYDYNYVGSLPPGYRLHVYFNGWDFYPVP